MKKIIDLSINDKVYFVRRDGTLDEMFLISEGSVIDIKDREPYVSYSHHGREEEYIDPDELSISLINEGDKFETFIRKNSESTHLTVSRFGNIEDDDNSVFTFYFVATTKEEAIDYIKEQLTQMYTYNENNIMRLVQENQKLKIALEKIENI